MRSLKISCPQTIAIDSFDNWRLSDNPYENIINIDGGDYILAYLDEEFKTNKGGNSFIFKLYNAQSFEENDEQIPDLIMKVSKYALKKRIVPQRTARFQNEIKALDECNKKKYQNVVNIFHKGELIITKKSNPNLRRRFLFYTMEYAEMDLKAFIEQNPNLTIFEKVDLCLQISKGIKELKNIGFYHRDIKPDNIFIVDRKWKIGDLGLISSRRKDYNIDSPNELIGPRGWFCPEAMNKYLTEDKNFDNKFNCEIDHQSDIFQLGKIFWYIHQGNAPIGNIKREDFLIKDERIYEIIRRMINYSKKRRFTDIEEVIQLLNPIHRKYFVTT